MESPLCAGPQVLLDTVTTGMGGILFIGGICERLTVSLRSVGTTSGGTILIEEAPYYDPQGTSYGGTWSQLASVSASTINTTSSQVQHFAGSFWAVRVRISSTITGGGTVTIAAWAN